MVTCLQSVGHHLDSLTWLQQSGVMYSVADLLAWSWVAGNHKFSGLHCRHLCPSPAHISSTTLSWQSGWIKAAKICATLASYAIYLLACLPDPVARIRANVQPSLAARQACRGLVA